MESEGERWMTVHEVAEYLQLSPAKIYEMARQHAVPCTRVAGRWRFRRDEIDRWMLAQRSAAAEAPDEGTGKL